MRIGSFKFKGQAYDCLGRFEYERPARCFWLYELRSLCPDCGRGFTCTATESAINKRMLRRRCDACRSPGVPVTPIAKPWKTAGKRVKKSDQRANLSAATLRKPAARAAGGVPTVATHDAACETGTHQRGLGAVPVPDAFDIQSAPMALRVLLDLAENSKIERTRLDAAKTILDLALGFSN
jgi:hypothetical protein